MAAAATKYPTTYVCRCASTDLVRWAVDTLPPPLGRQGLGGCCIKPPDGFSGRSEARELMSNEVFERLIAEVVRNQDIDDVPLVGGLDERDRAAFRPSTVGPHHVHHKLP